MINRYALGAILGIIIAGATVLWFSKDTVPPEVHMSSDTWVPKKVVIMPDKSSFCPSGYLGLMTEDATLHCFKVSK